MAHRIKPGAILFCLVIISASVFGQNLKEFGVPYIKNYTTEDYNFDPQNWEILQDDRGIMYFGNTKGLLVFDGTSWRTYETHNKTVIRSLAADAKGRIYYGSQGDFGFLTTDSTSTGTLSFHSLLDKIPAEHSDFRDVWTLVANEEYILFETNYKLVKISHDGKVKIFESEPGFHVANYINHTLFIREWGNGLLKLINDSLHLIPGSEIFANERVYSILPHTVNPESGEVEKYVFFAQNLGTYLYDHKSIIKWNIPAEKALIQSRVYSGININHEYFALGTGQSGIIIINKKGRIVKKLNKGAGLQSNNILKMYIDKNQNLWAALENGISFIEINSPFSYFTESLSKLPNKQVVTTLHNDKLYVATEQGVYYRNWTSEANGTTNTHFQLVNNTAGQVWRFSKINGELYACHNPGLLIIHDCSASVHSLPYTNVWNLKALKSKPGYAIAGTSDGFELYEMNNDLTWKNSIAGYKKDGRNFMEDKEGNIWISNSLKGVYKTTFNQNLDSLIMLDFYNARHGLPSDNRNQIINNNRYIIVENDFGLFVYNHNTNRFIPYEPFNKHIEQFVNFDFFEFDKNGNIWFVNNGQVGFMRWIGNGQYEYHNITYDKFKNLKILEVDEYNDTTILIATNKDLIHFNPEMKIRKDYHYNALIRKVEVLSIDSLIFNGNFINADGKFVLHPEEDYMLELPYKYKSLRFNYTAIYYEDNDKNKFATMLEGFDEDWSDWTSATKKEYINIPVGDFTFKVKAKNVFQQESDAAVFRFTVLPPWYRTWLAYFIYAVLILIGIRMIIHLYTRRLKLANIRLEETVRNRTAEIAQQKEEIQTQAEHLAQTNRELEKLSIVARETNNGVMIMDADCNFEWVNEGFTKMIGYTYDQLLNEIGDNLQKTSFYKNIDETLNYLRKKKTTVIYEAPNITRDGKKIWVQTTITPILNEGNEIVKLIAIDSDVTQLKKAENEIIKQRDEIFRQKKEITDSIIYSRHIQNAILPSIENIQGILPNSFVFNKPKEIIGGDFYWISRKDNKIIIAVADCTGHGVPGALMSMLGITFLNEIVNNKGITSPAKILNRLRKRIIQILHQDKEEETSHDGMDMALCTFDLTAQTMKFAGANNSMLMVNKSGSKELLPDKMPIREHYSKDKNFNEQELAFTKEDIFYMYSDGFADQFGGPEGKRFLNSNFKKLLQDVYALAFEHKYKKINEEFESWKGTLEQVDDVLVLGFSISI